MSPSKNTMNYVASTTAELYCRRPSVTQSLPLSNSSSSSVPSSTFDYTSPPVASSSSSTGTSWFQCDDDRDDNAVANSPTSFRHFSAGPQYSPGHLGDDPNASSQAPGPSYYPPSLTDSDQYLYGSSSWSNSGMSGTGWGGPAA